MCSERSYIRQYANIMIRRSKIIETEVDKMQKRDKNNYPEAISMVEYLTRRRGDREDALEKRKWDASDRQAGSWACRPVYIII